MLRRLLNRISSAGRAVTEIEHEAFPKDDADCLIARGDQAEREGNLREACEHYRAAVEMAPRYATAHLNLGVALEASGDADGAAEAYETALVIDPANPYANYNLGKLLYTRGLLDRAEELLRCGIKHKPKFAEAQVVLSSVYEAQGKLGDAAAALQLALEHKPDWAGALFNYGTVLKNLRRLSEAVAILQRAIVLEPGNADWLNTLGNVLVEQGRRDESIPYYKRALELKPDFAEAHFNLGNCFSDQRRWEEAFACYNKAVQLNPKFAASYVGLGNALKERGQPDDAIICYQKALRLKPDLPEAHCNLGGAFRDQDRFDEALHHLAEALSLLPESADVRWLFTMCQIPAVCEGDDEPERFRNAFSRQLQELEQWFDATRLASGVSAVGNQQPFYLAYQEQSNGDLLRRHGSLCVRIMRNWFEQQRFIAPGRRNTGNAIRVGIVSGHFYSHPVWDAIVKGWMQELDHERFTLHCSYLGSKQDTETQIAISRAAHFEQGNRELRQWVDTILDQRLDVLVYPEIGMDPLTLKLASLRLAPAQVTTWGHPETTGLETIDHYLSAVELEPPDAHKNYTENLVLLPHLGCWFERSGVHAADPNLANSNIDTGYPLLLCPGTPFKYSPTHDWVLTEIARRLGRCRFVFFTHSVRNMSEKLRRRLEVVFSRAGLRFSDFVTFIPWQSRPAFHGWLKRADVVLDTIGFSGFNTAMQAMECAAPIVAKEGRFMRGRLASGILRRMGITELVAQSEEDYVKLVVRLAQDAQYGAHMRERIQTSRSILFEDAAPIRAMEAFLSEVATRH